MDLLKHFVLYILVASTYIVGKRIVANNDPWHKKLIWATTHGILFLFAFTICPNLTTLVGDISDQIIVAYGNSPIIILFMAIGAAIATYFTWYLVDRDIIKPQPGNERFFLAIGLIAAALFSFYIFLSKLGVKSIVTSNDDLSIGFAIGMAGLAGIIFIKFKDKIQNAIAIPVGGAITFVLFGLSYYNRYGIDLMTKIGQDGETGATGLLVILAVAATYSTIWHVSKDWNKRLTYKILSSVMMLLTLNALWISFLYISGANTHYQKENTYALNNVNQARFDREMEISLNTPRAGLTHNEARAISRDPKNSGLEKLEQVKRSLELHAAAIKEIEDRREKLMSSDNNKDGLQITKDFLTGGADAGISATEWLVGEFQKRWHSKEKKTTGSANTKSAGRTFTFTGIGMSGGADGRGAIPVLLNGTDVRYGQWVKINGNAQTFHDGRYRDLEGFENKADVVDHIWMRARAGETFTVTVR
jgi:hypothetical protein